MALIFVTRKLPGLGFQWMREGGHELVINEADRSLTNEELLERLAERPYDGVVTLLSDKVDEEFFKAAPNVRIVSNYAVGYNNINLDVAAAHDVTITNTPGVLTDTVAEYAVSLILSVTKRIPESDRFTRAGKYEGWAPELLLGSDMKGKTLGILGAGRIGTGVAERMVNGFGMRVVYYDIKPNEYIDALGAEFRESVDDVLREADVVSVHVPLLDSTHHLINAERLGMMKPSAYLVNTSRGPVIDESALAEALQNGTIRGAGLDVFEDEPALAPGLAELENVVVTPHVASATVETRNKMAEMVAINMNDFFRGEEPPNRVTE